MNSLFSVGRVSAEIVRRTIEQDHYLHRWPDPRALPFAYWLRRGDGFIAPDGRPWGICIFSLLQHHRQQNLFGYEGLPTCWQVLNLARVWINPYLQGEKWQGTNRAGVVVAMQANAFSRMVSLCLRQVQRDWLYFHPPVYPDLPYHITLIVSYCDRAHHHGIGYRAANFMRWGETSDQTKDVYVRRLALPRWSWSGPKQLSLKGL